jgi:predicted GNAT family acetyltransferase
VPDPRRLLDANAVLAAADRDPYARNTVREDLTHGWARDGAVAWLGLDAEDRVPYVSALGHDDRAVAALLADVRPELPPVPVTVPAAAVRELRIGFTPQFHWTLWTCETPPAPPDVPVRELTDRAGVAALLNAVGGLHSAAPDDEKVRRWVGVRDGDRLVACAADTSAAPGVGHMGSVAVHPAARRRGLAGAVVGWLTRDLLRHGADVVVVGVFVAEQPAMRLYERVGFRARHEFLSGELTGVKATGE